MSEVQKEIEVDVPVRTAYNQWTQFESFPSFMDAVEEVKQLSDTRLKWRAMVGGKEEEWEAAITKQEPDRRVAWTTTSGAKNAGDVQFEPLGDRKTLVKVHMVYEPKGVVENVGDALGVVARQVEGDLRHFKEFIETRGSETGAWRGEVYDANPEGAGNPEA
jgi:uncharacterized membrane protein